MRPIDRTFNIGVTGLIRRGAPRPRAGEGFSTEEWSPAVPRDGRAPRPRAGEGFSTSQTPPSLLERSTWSPSARWSSLAPQVCTMFLVAEMFGQLLVQRRLEQAFGELLSSSSGSVRERPCSRASRTSSFVANLGPAACHLRSAR